MKNTYVKKLNILDRFLFLIKIYKNENEIKRSEISRKNLEKIIKIGNEMIKTLSGLCLNLLKLIIYFLFYYKHVNNDIYYY
jgi:hypothetical protein